MSIWLVYTRDLLSYEFRRRRTISYRDLQTPTHCRLIFVPAGAIHARSSEIVFDGNTTFKRNSALEYGGEK